MSAVGIAFGGCRLHETLSLQFGSFDRNYEPSVLNDRPAFASGAKLGASAAPIASFP